MSPNSLVKVRVHGVGWSLDVVPQASGETSIRLVVGDGQVHWFSVPLSVLVSELEKVGEPTCLLLHGPREVVGALASQRVALRPYDVYTGHGVYREDVTLPARKVGKRKRS